MGPETMDHRHENFLEKAGIPTFLVKIHAFSFLFMMFYAFLTRFPAFLLKVILMSGTRNMEGFQILSVGENWSTWRKHTKVVMELANQIHIQGERKVFEHLTNPSRHWSSVPS